MHALPHSSRCLLRLLLLGVAIAFLTSCYVFEFFRRKKGQRDGDTNDLQSGTVVGQPLGASAGVMDEALLAAVHAIPATHPPAAIRPDPDLFVRRLLRQYRPEGAVIARLIGETEDYRLLLGGASPDFAKTPQEEYDATSLLAVFKVAEEVCHALVAPPSQYGSWQTILPYSPELVTENLSWLAQRFIGLPSAQIDPAVVPALVEIIKEEARASTVTRVSSHPYAMYVPACATLALDAEALYL